LVPGKGNYLTVLLNSLVFGLAIAVMVVGLIGTVVPILPGTLLVWLAVLAYAIVENFQAIDIAALIFISLIALLTGTADIWMALLGAKSGGASGRSLLYGLAGGIAGFFLLGGIIPIVGSLLGGVLGYALGILLGQYQKFGDWNLATRASFGGIVGWGMATILEFIGGILIVVIFIWQVLTF
jgi:uncharacterized protein YqgC (DUF456 family)